jgi:hypothetical protein
MLIGLRLVRLCLSCELARPARVVGRLGQAGAPSHLLALFTGSVSMLSGLFDRLTRVFSVIWFAHYVRSTPFAAETPRILHCSILGAGWPEIKARLRSRYGACP